MLPTGCGSFPLLQGTLPRFQGNAAVNNTLDHLEKRPRIFPDPLAAGPLASGQGPDRRLGYASLPLRQMARQSLRPHLNQIRTWVRQGRTDAWVAHQLEVTVQEIAQFKRQNDLVTGDEPDATNGVDFSEEIDLRAEDDALIAAELEAAEAERARIAAEKAAAAEAEEDDDEAPAPARRRGRRGGRGRTARSNGPLEGTFDHGEEGYGLWLDPAIADNAIYAEHWAGHRPVEVVVEEDQIVIRRAGTDDD